MTKQEDLRSKWGTTLYPRHFMAPPPPLPFFFLSLKRRSCPHFYFALGSANYASSSACMECSFPASQNELPCVIHRSFQEQLWRHQPSAKTVLVNMDSLEIHPSSASCTTPWGDIGIHVSSWWSAIWFCGSIRPFPLLSAEDRSWKFVVTQQIHMQFIN